MPKVTTDKEVIRKLGPAEVADALGYSEHAVTKWMNANRGIPWKDRAKIARLAASKRIKLPANFVEERPA